MIELRIRKPGLDVLLENFLSFQIGSDGDDGPMRKQFMNQRHEKWMCRRADAGAGQRSAILQSPREGLHSGSERNVSEQIACRRRYRVLRQAILICRRLGLRQATLRNIGRVAAGIRHLLAQDGGRG